MWLPVSLKHSDAFEEFLVCSRTSVTHLAISHYVRRQLYKAFISTRVVSLRDKRSLLCRYLTTGTVIRYIKRVLRLSLRDRSHFWTGKATPVASYRRIKKLAFHQIVGQPDLSFCYTKTDFVTDSWARALMFLIGRTHHDLSRPTRFASINEN